MTQIATAISNNLPNFSHTTRRTIIDSRLYKTIAANIIGYAQPVTNPPLTSTSYRGIGLYPLSSSFATNSNGQCRRLQAVPLVIIKKEARQAGTILPMLR